MAGSFEPVGSVIGGHLLDKLNKVGFSRRLLTEHIAALM
jgi:hypothetical protein